MMGWDDMQSMGTAEGRAESELEQLLNAVIPFAQQMLSKHGEFNPFAAAVSREGRLKFIGIPPHEQNKITEDLIDRLRETLIIGASKGDYRATGICSDVSVAVTDDGEKSDAVRISLEHLDGQSMNVFLPYRMDPAGEIEYGEIFASVTDPVVFLRGFND